MSRTLMRCLKVPALGFVWLLVASASLAQNNSPLTRVLNQTDWEVFSKRLAPPFQKSGMSAVAGSNGVTFSMAPSKYNGPNSLQADVRLPNNFQIEVKYELVTVPDKVPNGYGVGVGLWVEGAAVDGQARAVRTIEPNRGPQYMAGRTSPLPGDKIHYAIAMSPAQSRNGRLGLRRIGKEIIMLAAESPTAPLEEYQRYPLSEAPTRMISLYSTTGGAEVEFKARLYDLRILTGADLPPEPAKRNLPTATIVKFPPHVPSVVAAKGDVESPEPTDPERTDTTASALFPWLIGVVTFLIGLPLGVIIGRKWKTPQDDADDSGRGQDDE
jgi:hypothetical protein